MKSYTEQDAVLCMHQLRYDAGGGATPQGGISLGRALALTRYCTYQYCMVYGITRRGGRWGARMLHHGLATVLQ